MGGTDGGTDGHRSTLDGWEVVKQHKVVWMSVIEIVTLSKFEQ
ncbi:unnamed protein product, partial [Staurois parvus]